MISPFQNKFSVLALGGALSALALLPGCGGGGGGSSTPSPAPPPTTPGPFDASYRATFTPTDTLPTDGQAPTGNLTISGNRAFLQTTFFLQPSVVNPVQAAIDQALRDNGVASDIANNRVPQNITFTGTGQLDGSGKVVLVSTRPVSICGTATLTVSPTFNNNGVTTSGSGTYEVGFPNSLSVFVRGRTIAIAASPGGVAFTCNNLPLRTGTVTFNR